MLLLRTSDPPYVDTHGQSDIATVLLGTVEICHCCYTYLEYHWRKCSTRNVSTVTADNLRPTWIRGGAAKGFWRYSGRRDGSGQWNGWRGPAAPGICRIAQPLPPAAPQQPLTWETCPKLEQNNKPCRAVVG